MCQQNVAHPVSPSYVYWEHDTKSHLSSSDLGFLKEKYYLCLKNSIFMISHNLGEIQISVGNNLLIKTYFADANLDVEASIQ